jgi:hypothetical protein
MRSAEKARFNVKLLLLFSCHLSQRFFIDAYRRDDAKEKGYQAESWYGMQKRLTDKPDMNREKRHGDIAKQFMDRPPSPVIQGQFFSEMGGNRHG